MAMKLKVQYTIRETEKIRQVASQPEVEQLRTLQHESTVPAHRESAGWQKYEIVRIHGSKVHVVLPCRKTESSLINVVRPYHDQMTKAKEF